jgi:bacteriocin biosynthesis cyclodehydratase domain-containing protein
MLAGTIDKISKLITAEQVKETTAPTLTALKNSLVSPNTVLTVGSGQLGLELRRRLEIQKWQPIRLSLDLHSTADTALRQAIGQNNFMIAAFDRPYPALCKKLNQLCRDSNCTWLLLEWRGSELTLSPLFLPDQPGCYKCYQARRHANYRTGRVERLLDDFYSQNATYQPQASLPLLTRLAGSLLELKIAELLSDDLKVGRWWTYNFVTQEAQQHGFNPVGACSVCSPDKNNALESGYQRLQANFGDYNHE